MKKVFFFTLCLITSSIICNAQVDLNKIKSSATKAKNEAKTISTTNALPKSLSEEDIVKGLKEALNVGTKNSVSKASVANGFLSNPNIKIPFPKEAQQVETDVRKLGMGNEVDKFVETLNKAAEVAAKDAAPIFVNAITKMTVTDGAKILKGKDDEATQYLKNSTTTDLEVLIKPIVKKALDEVAITEYWGPIIKKYNKIPMVKPLNPDLEAYTTQKAIEGLFVLIAEEEAKIRKDPAAQVSDILKKVFGK